MTYTRTWLIERVAQGERVKYLPFWGHAASPDGRVTQACFSQWWEGHPFQVNGHTYLTAEHYMMAGKAKLFGDEEVWTQIMQATSPGEAKEWGRKVRNFDHTIWETHRCDIVIQGNYGKFGQHEALQTFLLNTKQRILVEASPRDQIWGIGLDQAHPDAENPFKWQGENLLGFCLMEVRDILLAETQSAP